MILFLQNNLSTIIVGILLALVIAGVIMKLVKDKKHGKSVGCGCGCKSCPNSGMCHSGEGASHQHHSKS